MKSTIRILLTMLIFSLICFFPSLFAGEKAQQYDALLGTWDVETEAGTYAFVFKFTVEEDALIGKFTGSSGEEVDMEELTFKDNELSFTVTINAGGQAMVIDFSATVKGDELEGMLSLEYGEANITGTKRK